MEQEVPSEVQAAMAIKLVDNVRAMIRKEIVEAFNDAAFVSTLNIGFFASVTMQGMRYNSDFKKVLRDVIIEQMQKY